MSRSTTISRRVALRGLGVTLSLPLLDAMRPSARLLAGPAAGEGVAPVRLACLFFPNGVNPHTWTPKEVGAGYELSPTLQPLAAVKDEVLVLSGLTHRATCTGDGHYTKDAAWLTGTTIRRTTGSELDSGGVSLDQLVARGVGNLTRLPSLELGVEPISTGVDVNVGFTRLYGGHISWATPTTPVARELNPRQAFDRLFRDGNGSGGSDADDASILDLVREDARSLRGRVGRDDRRKLDDYLESVRSVERRIVFEAAHRGVRYQDDPAARQAIAALKGRIDLHKGDPGRVFERDFDHTEHARIMLDLMILGFQADTTRVASFMFGNSVSNKNFSFLDGVKGAHHELSHHSNDPEKLKQYELIARWHVEQFAYALGRMKAIPEGDGTLLDHSMVLFGSALRDGNAHDPHDIPTLLGGRGGGSLAPGRHLHYRPDTPLSSLHLGMLQGLGQPVASFGDADSALPGLGDPSYGVFADRSNRVRHGQC